ncbi:MAG: hypothetical protein DYH13_00425 [Alphaproteobacteria bacterium PRO2]|nr:hypothetical protein [Alphaproteobacteria bacterium PRO2]
MEKYRKTVLTAILLSETSHIFCCVLPTVFSIVSVLSGIGIISALPAGWTHLHDLLHHYEVPMIVLSGMVLALGWGLHYYTEHMGPHEQHKHCCDGHCGPKEQKKNKVHMILKVATILFLVNVTVYFMFHRGHSFF